MRHVLPSPARLNLEDILTSGSAEDLLAELIGGGIIELKVCLRCGDRYLGGHVDTKYCSERCNKAASSAAARARRKAD